MAAINLPFAASATRRAPDSGELADGFGCGPADKDLFDWLAWWETGQIASVIAKAGLTPDDTDLLQLARAIRRGKLNYVVAGGTANALTATLDPAPLGGEIEAGFPLRVLLTGTNTGASTLNVNAAGSVAIRKRNGEATVAGDLPSGGVIDLIFDGTYWRLDGLVLSDIPRNEIADSTAGTRNFTVPAGVYRIFVELVGGGGGGGGSGGPSVGGTGGGAGGYARKAIDVTPGQVISYTVGAGGAGGAGAANGANGGTTSFGGLFSASGGGAGQVNPATGGAAGGGTGGDLNVFGGGGFAAPTGLGGHGAGSFFGTGGISVPGGTGGAGGVIGSGGAGGYANNAGGAGAVGMVVIKY